MRRAAFCLVLCLSALPAFGQFHIPPPRVTGWQVAPSLQLTWIRQEAAFLGRVGSGVTFNETLGLGLAAHVLLNDVQPFQATTPVPLRFLWGGADAEWVFDSNRLFHVAVGGTVGPGLAWYNGTEVFAEPALSETDWLIVAEGRAGIIVNLTTRARAGLYYTARWVDETNLRGLNDQGLRRQGLLFMVKLGSF